MNVCEVLTNQKKELEKIIIQESRFWFFSNKQREWRKFQTLLEK